MGSQVPLQLSQRGEIQTTLHTHVLLAFLVLQLMGSKLTRVGESSTAHTAAGGVCEREMRTIADEDNEANLHVLYFHKALTCMASHHCAASCASLSDSFG